MRRSLLRGSALRRWGSRRHVPPEGRSAVSVAHARLGLACRRAVLPVYQGPGYAEAIPKPVETL